ncbi:MAG: BamA/TamA family outer membrane protein [Bacteroidia bacterium]
MLLLASHLWACKTTRHLEPGQYLVKTDPTLRTSGDLPAATLQGAVRIEDNRRVLLPKLALYTHNWGRSLEKTFRRRKPPILPDDGQKGVGPWFYRLVKYRMGEPPVLLTPDALRLDSINLREACFANGFFSPRIEVGCDTLRTIFGKDRQQVRVAYRVDEGLPFRLRHIRLVLRDTTDAINAEALRLAYFPVKKGTTQLDTMPLLKTGDLYQHARFEQERVRATQALRNAAFFTFTQDLIQFRLDTALAVNASDSARRAGKWMDVEIVVTRTPTRYVVDEIVINVKAPRGTDRGGPPLVFRADRLDSLARDSLGLSHKRLASGTSLTFRVDPAVLHRVNYTFLAERIHLRERWGYFRDLDLLTQRRLLELGMFEYQLLKPEIVAPERVVINIDLELAARYELRAGTEAFTRDITFNGSLIPNVGANFGLRNKNFLGRSERLDLRFGGSIGWNSINLGTPNYYELGAEAGIQFHKFLFLTPFAWMLPRKIARDLSLFSPQTQVGASFRVENWQQVNQFSPGASLTYRWSHLPFQDKSVSRFTPLAVEYIEPNVSSQNNFDAIVAQLPDVLQRDFSQRFSSRLQYSYTHQNYRQSRAFPTYWYQLSAEWGGNLPLLLDQLAVRTGNDRMAGDNRFLDTVFYGQYVKAYAEGRLFWPTGKRTELVFRGRIGASTPYNGTPLLPKESRFFTGGVNGLRGWQSNTLGPGRVAGASDFGVGDTLLSNAVRSLLAPGGAYIFEVNAEYRFDVGTYVELAVFTDAGNVWFGRASEAVLGTTRASLRPGNLALGWDAGIGFRFDFSFLVLRADIGQQLYAPDLPGGWVLPDALGDAQRRQLNLGIGYPF